MTQNTDHSDSNLNLDETALSSHLAMVRTAVFALACAAFGSGISLRLTDPLLPRFASEFSISLAQSAYVVSVFSIAYGLAQLLFGPLGDRFGKFKVIAWACIACAFTNTLCALAQDFPQLVGARLLAGVSAAAIIPLAMAWIGDMVAYEHRQPVLARFLIGQILGLSAGVWFGGWVAEHLSWRIPFAVLAVLFVGLGLLLFEVQKKIPKPAMLSGAQGSSTQRLVHEFSQVIATVWARTVLLTVFLEGAFLYGAFAFIATHLHAKFNLSLATAGAMVMFFGFGGLLFALASARLVQRLGEVGLARAGGVIMAIALLLIGFSPFWWWAAPSCFLLGLGFYMLHNTLQINATQMAPERRGAAVAAFASCFFLGQAIGTSIAGVLITYLNSDFLMLLGAVGVCATAFVFSQLRAQRQIALQKF